MQERERRKKRLVKGRDRERDRWKEVIMDNNDNMKQKQTMSCQQNCKVEKVNEKVNETR